MWKYGCSFYWRGGSSEEISIDLYRAFCEFCQIRNYIVIPYESFSIKISECFKTLERCKIRTPDGQVNGYSGVRIKSLI